MHLTAGAAIGGTCLIASWVLLLAAVLQLGGISLPGAAASLEPSYLLFTTAVHAAALAVMQAWQLAAGHVALALPLVKLHRGPLPSCAVTTVAPAASCLRYQAPPTHSSPGWSAVSSEGPPEGGLGRRGTARGSAAAGVAKRGKHASLVGATGLSTSQTATSQGALSPLAHQATPLVPQPSPSQQPQGGQEREEDMQPHRPKHRQLQQQQEAWSGHAKQFGNEVEAALCLSGPSSTTRSTCAVQAEALDSQGPTPTVAPQHPQPTAGSTAAGQCSVGAGPPGAVSHHGRQLTLSQDLAVFNDSITVQRSALAAAGCLMSSNPSLPSSIFSSGRRSGMPALLTSSAALHWHSWGMTGSGLQAVYEPHQAELQAQEGQEEGKEEEGEEEEVQQRRHEGAQQQHTLSKGCGLDQQAGHRAAPVHSGGPLPPWPAASAVASPSPGPSALLTTDGAGRSGVERLPASPPPTPCSAWAEQHADQGRGAAQGRGPAGHAPAALDPSRGLAALWKTPEWVVWDSDPPPEHLATLLPCPAHQDLNLPPPCTPSRSLLNLQQQQQQQRTQQQLDQQKGQWGSLARQQAEVLVPGQGSASSANEDQGAAVSRAFRIHGLHCLLSNILTLTTVLRLHVQQHSPRHQRHQHSNLSQPEPLTLLLLQPQPPHAGISPPAAPRRPLTPAASCPASALVAPPPLSAAGLCQPDQQGNLDAMSLAQLLAALLLGSTAMLLHLMRMLARARSMQRHRSAGSGHAGLWVGGLAWTYLLLAMELVVAGLLPAWPDQPAWLPALGITWGCIGLASATNNTITAVCQVCAAVLGCLLLRATQASRLPCSPAPTVGPLASLLLFGLLPLAAAAAWRWGGQPWGASRKQQAPPLPAPWQPSPRPSAREERRGTFCTSFSPAMGGPSSSGALATKDARQPSCQGTQGVEALPAANDRVGQLPSRSPTPACAALGHRTPHSLLGHYPPSTWAPLLAMLRLALPNISSSLVQAALSGGGQGSTSAGTRDTQLGGTRGWQQATDSPIPPPLPDGLMYTLGHSRPRATGFLLNLDSADDPLALPTNLTPGFRPYSGSAGCLVDGLMVTQHMVSLLDSPRLQLTRSGTNTSGNGSRKQIAAGGRAAGQGECVAQGQGSEGDQVLPIDGAKGGVGGRSSLVQGQGQQQWGGHGQQGEQAQGQPEQEGQQGQQGQHVGQQGQQYGQEGQQGQQGQHVGQQGQQYGQEGQQGQQGQHVGQQGQQYGQEGQQGQQGQQGEGQLGQGRQGQVWSAPGSGAPLACSPLPPTPLYEQCSNHLVKRSAPLQELSELLQQQGERQLLLEQQPSSGHTASNQLLGEEQGEGLLELPYTGQAGAGGRGALELMLAPDAARYDMLLQTSLSAPHMSTHASSVRLVTADVESPASLLRGVETSSSMLQTQDRGSRPSCPLRSTALEASHDMATLVSLPPGLPLLRAPASAAGPLPPQPPAPIPPSCHSHLALILPHHPSTLPIQAMVPHSPHLPCDPLPSDLPQYSDLYQEGQALPPHSTDTSRSSACYSRSLTFAEDQLTHTAPQGGPLLHTQPAYNPVQGSPSAGPRGPDTWPQHGPSAAPSSGPSPGTHATHTTDEDSTLRPSAGLLAQAMAANRSGLGCTSVTPGTLVTLTTNTQGSVVTPGSAPPVPLELVSSQPGSSMPLSRPCAQHLSSFLADSPWQGPSPLPGLPSSSPLPLPSPAFYQLQAPPSLGSLQAQGWQVWQQQVQQQQQQQQQVWQQQVQRQQQHIAWHWKQR
ncbi:hypothetical protein V8C86DRAFT_3149848, partial [Haematococcus lacustris]